MFGFHFPGHLCKANFYFNPKKPKNSVSKKKKEKKKERTWYWKLKRHHYLAGHCRCPHHSRTVHPYPPFLPTCSKMWPTGNDSWDRFLFPGSNWEGLTVVKIDNHEVAVYNNFYGIKSGSGRLCETKKKIQIS